tara:strand:- start:591 stop:758 length:168 start_codon:yes stop_codon:yes gene_type:complete
VPELNIDEPPEQTLYAIGKMVFQREKQMLKVQSQFDYCLDLTANANSSLRTAPKP